MMSIFDNVQKKTPKEKRKLLWIFTGVSTLIIFILWIGVFPKDYLEKKEGQKSFNDLKEEFDNSKDNKQFNEYMNGLEIFNNFDKRTDFENYLKGAQNTDIQPNHNQNTNYPKETKEETNFLRLPLE